MKVISGALLSVSHVCINIPIIKKSPVLKHEWTELLSNILFQELKGLNIKTPTLRFRIVSIHCSLLETYLHLDTFNKSTVLNWYSYNQQCTIFPKWPKLQCPFSSLCKNKPKFLWFFDQWKVMKLIKLIYLQLISRCLVIVWCSELSSDLQQKKHWGIDLRGKYFLIAMFIHSLCLSFYIPTVQDVNGGF